MVDILELPMHLRRACIAHRGALTSLFEYIPRMRKSESEYASVFTTLLFHFEFCVCSSSVHSIVVWFLDDHVDSLEVDVETQYLMNLTIHMSRKIVQEPEKAFDI